VLAVGLPGMKGLHALVRVLNELQSTAVEPSRVLPVVNRSPRGGRARSEITATIDALASASGRSFGPVLFLPDKRVDEALRDGVALPAALAGPLAGAFRATAAAAPARRTAEREPVLVRAGSLGSWTAAADEEDEPGEAAAG